MKRSNDYIQSHDGYKKPRVGQGYNGYQGGPNTNMGNMGSLGNLGNMGGMGGMGNMGNPAAVDMYGGNGYGTNPMMMMGAYGQMAGSQYGADPTLALPSAYAPYPAAPFGSPYNATPFNVSYPMGSGSGVPTGRTVYIGNVPIDATIEDILNQVRTGLVESAKFLPDKNCAFLSFMEASAAMAFHHEGTTKKITILGQDVKVGWGKPSAVPNQVLQAVQQGATRNVFIGGFDESITDEQLRTDCSTFGTIDTVKILREKGIAFVHFTSIGSAMKAVQGLPQDPKYNSRRINYGKDRCAKFASSTTTTGTNASFGFGSAGYGNYGSSMPGMFSSNFDRYGAAGRSGSNGATNTSTVPMSVLHAEGNRTVYIGGISPEAACEDICNAIRGGVLSKIRYFPAKHIAFVTFADPEAASNFLKQGSEQGVVIKARRVKVNWGQNAHALPLPVIQAFSNGATRNVYLGGVEGILDAAKIRQDFTEFGEVELVNMLSEKNCGFVNFTDVMSAVKAVEGIKRKPEYVNIRVNYGKDRCGNPPKANRTASSTEEGQAGPATNSATAAENNGRDSTNSRDFDEDDEMFQA